MSSFSHDADQLKPHLLRSCKVLVLSTRFRPFFQIACCEYWTHEFSIQFCCRMHIVIATQYLRDAHGLSVDVVFVTPAFGLSILFPCFVHLDERQVISLGLTELSLCLVRRNLFLCREANEPLILRLLVLIVLNRPNAFLYDTYFLGGRRHGSLTASR